MNTMIAAAALLTSFCSFLVSVYFWKRSFRPIVSAVVKTHAADEVVIQYDLVVLNSGTIPARNIRIRGEKKSLTSAFGRDASAENKTRWLACFDQTIGLLQNNDRVSCSFGSTMADDGGFWKHKAIISITLTYEDWFGWKYTDKQDIQIIDSDSFTGYMWG